MRRVLLALALSGVTAAVALPADPAHAQNREQRRQQDSAEQNRERRDNRPAPLRRRANAGPCPFVKILYDGARYVEMADNRPAAGNVGFTGEIEGLTSDCTYRDEQPITVDVNLLFNLGRGPRAEGDVRTYRYWIAVTERNRAILSKEYFDLPVSFGGADRTTSTAEHTIVIPRAEATTSGDNFEVVVGFDVTPEMAEFNRSGSRFRIQAGTQQ